ncbi:hypothetical protein HPP92_020801 [Vanilla planifolia]|uniref:Integrase zinc-binding domain-containing protein n=1 Tax=Vanilla planifolia TaxID=51239 RepID=A0A835UIU0_VANPL|nr:hypothetical protein HPP92_020801 [Vanilla planifolia]
MSGTVVYSETGSQTQLIDYSGWDRYIEMRDLQLCDEELKEKIELASQGLGGDFALRDDILTFRGRWCVPSHQEFRERILREAHYGTLAMHPGEVKMYRNLRSVFWWRGLKTDVAAFVRKCLTCQQVKANTETRRIVTDCRFRSGNGMTSLWTL